MNFFPAKVDLLDIDEPFDRLLTQGMVLKDGEVMSKSKGNIVDPGSVIDRYGADTLRLFILFAAPPEDQLEWNDGAIDGSWRFLNRIYLAVEKRFQKVDASIDLKSFDEKDKTLYREMHAAIKKVTNDFSKDLKFNTAISQMMILANETMKEKKIPKEVMEKLVLILAPFAPHMCEELWEMLGHKETLAYEAWPEFKEEYLKEDEVEVLVKEDLCVPWSCGGWSVCEDGEKVRECVSVDGCDVQMEKPNEVEECLCEEDWVCDEWSVCGDSREERKCFDSNGCGTEFDKPKLEQACGFDLGIWFGVIVSVLVMIILIIGIFLARIFLKRRN